MTQIHPRRDPPPQAELDPAGHLLLSHDLRSALGQMVSAVQLLGETALDEAGAARLLRVKASAQYMVDLLDDAAGQPPELPITDLGPALAQLNGIWGPEAAKRGLQFEIQCAEDLPESLRMPGLDFNRIFNNLIGNALKFTQNGTICLRAFRANVDLVFEVVDEGAGFSDAALSKLFTLRGRPTENKESGSGFGLYIARSLVEKAGGMIEGKNRQDGGAKVVLRFPEDLQMVAAPPIRVENDPASGLPDLSHLKILLAEDNPTNQLVATRMLTKMNAHVETAADGIEAMERFEQGDYNLGLIDIEMPRKSGLEVLRDIRARPDAKAKVKLLALTAYVLPEHRERITRAGADGIIAKPLTDIAAFGHTILSHTGGGAPAQAKPPSGANIEMDIYNGLKDIIGEAAMQELLEKVQNDLASVQGGVRAGAATKNPEPIRANTHILISVAGAIGAVNLQHLAEALNAKAKTSLWEDILPLAERCVTGISEVMDFVKQELDR